MKPRPAASRALSMPRSAIREIMVLAAGREDVIHMEIGEPDFSTPDHITTGAFEAVQAGFTKYTPNPGLASLRKKIADHVSNRWGALVSADRVVVTTGAVGGLFCALMAVTDAGDEILVPDPGWPNYESIVHLAGAKPVRFELGAESGFVPDVHSVERLITQRTKAIMINSPGNPTGVVLPADVMQSIGDLAKRHGLFVISDEVYEDIVFEGEHVSAAHYVPDDRLFLVSGASKTYCMTGWRIGYGAGPEDIIRAMAKVQGQTTTHPSSIGQYAAVEALTGDQTSIGNHVAAYRRRRDFVVAELNAAEGIDCRMPEGAFYVYPSCAGIIGKTVPNGSVLATDEDFALALLESEGVAVVHGAAFGLSPHFRITTAAADEKLAEACRRIQRFCAFLT